MKAIFLIFHGFEESNGISKKIRYQVKALKECGVDIRICWLDDTDNWKRRMVDDQVIEDYGNGIKGKIRKRTNLDCVYRYAMKEGIEVVYARSDHNTTPFLINLYRKLRRKGIKIALEIPTYPYDQEYKGLSFGYQRVLWIDKYLRHFMAHYINKIVTFSNDSFIFGYFLASGLAFMAMIAFSIMCDIYSWSRLTRPLEYAGQNPMIAYVSTQLVVLPLLNLAGLGTYLSYLDQNAWLGFLRGVIITSLALLITILFIKLKCFWRT